MVSVSKESTGSNGVEEEPPATQLTLLATTRNSTDTGQTFGNEAKYPKIVSSTTYVQLDTSYLIFLEKFCLLEFLYFLTKL